MTVADHAELDPRASPIADARLRLNVVCPYYTMFPLAFPFEVLAGAKAGEWVLDPFCGRGTTVYAARLLGLPTVGIDVDDVAVAVARAKLENSSAERVEARCHELLATVPVPTETPEGDFWRLAFHPATLNELCRLREALGTVDTSEDVLLRALVLGILHGPQAKKAPNYLSNQMPRTYATKPEAAVRYWRRHGNVPRRVVLEQAVARRARHVLAYVPPVVSGSVLRADARALVTIGSLPRFSWVVTSPPYLGMRTYGPDQWLRHWFLGGPATVDYSRRDGLPYTPAEHFTRELGRVWAAVAAVCQAGATLAIRFGALPSVSTEPESVLRASLVASGAPWRVETIRSAGLSSAGRRQARQMQRAGEAIEEIDVTCRLVS